MSKTGEWIINAVEGLSQSTGYSFKFLMEKYFAIVNEIEKDAKRTGEEPMATLGVRALDNQWVESNGSKKQGEVNVKINVDTTELEKAGIKLRHLGRMAWHLRDQIADSEHDSEQYRGSSTPTAIYDHLTERFRFIDPETTKIRKHNHDTLWAMFVGFVCGTGMVVVFGFMVIGILFYARG